MMLDAGMGHGHNEVQVLIHSGGFNLGAAIALLEKSLSYNRAHLLFILNFC
jgi:hypothetical protein